MNPYEVLGVGPATPIDEIEAAYRLRLREWHPDLHQAEGPEAVARAEDQTRQLNAAMARIRHEFKEGGPGAWRAYDAPPAPGDDRTDPDERGWWETDYQRWYGYDRTSPFSGSGPTGGRGGPGAHQRDAWSPPRPNEDWFGTPNPDDIVPCPYCGATFDMLESFQLHLATDHQFRQTVYRAPRRDWSFGILDVVGKVRYVPLWLVVPIAVILMWVLPFWAWTISWGFVALVLWAQTSARFHDRYHR